VVVVGGGVVVVVVVILQSITPVKLQLIVVVLVVVLLVEVVEVVLVLDVLVVVVVGLGHGLTAHVVISHTVGSLQNGIQPAVRRMTLLAISSVVTSGQPSA